MSFGAQAMLERIRTHRDRLSPSEQRVADAVIRHPEAILRSPISRIAEMANVSQPTVVRFCRSMACTGLVDFKLRMARSSTTGTPFVHNHVAPTDGTNDIASKVFDNAVSSLMRSRSDVDNRSLEAAVTALSDARRIEFYGLGNSGITVQDAQHKFFRLGIPCVAYNDPHVQGMAATLLEAGDVVLVISASGRTIDLINTVNVARARGAKVIAITHGDTPLALAADITLRADTQEDPDIYSSMTTRIVHLVFIDILAVAVAVRGGPTTSENLARAKQTLHDRRLSVAT
jgi:RpiR family carbohydrate utilization transcriptional regulator